MKLVPITSLTNPLLKKVRGLGLRSKREKFGLFLVEGPKLLNEAFQKQVEIEAIIASKDFFAAGLPQVDQSNFDSIYVVDNKLFLELNTTASSCGILATARIKQYSIDELFAGDRTLIVIGDAIQDPGNMGTMLRVALAFGATGAAFTKGSVDPYNPKVVRSTMGALFSLPSVFNIEVDILLEELKHRNVRLITLVPGVDTVLSDCKCYSPIAYAFGNEGHGLSKILLEHSDQSISIPIEDAAESLNVAVSAGIVLYNHSQISNADNN